MKLTIHVQTTWTQSPLALIYCGVVAIQNPLAPDPWVAAHGLLLFVITFVGRMMAHDTVVITRNIFRSIFVKPRKIVASIPIFPANSVSFNLNRGDVHANSPLPIDGGACFSSAYFSFGAYTIV